MKMKISKMLEAFTIGASYGLITIISFLVIMYICYKYVLKLFQEIKNQPEVKRTLVQKLKNMFMSLI